MRNKIVSGILVLLVFANCHPTNKLDKHSLRTVPASLLGNFKDDYGIQYSITDKIWTQHPGIQYHLLKYDSAGLYFIAKNDAANPGEPGLYTRIDVMRFTNMEPWTWGFCLTIYKAKNVEEAIAAIPADRNNPKKGCGGYPFSRMKRE